MNWMRCLHFSTMIFTIADLSDFRQFQTQVLCVKLPALEQPYCQWKPDVSSWLFEYVSVSIQKKSENRTMHTTRLRSSDFLAGSSLLNQVDSQAGGVVKFPLEDLLKCWIHVLRVPKEKNEDPPFLERVLSAGFQIRLVIQFAKASALYFTEIPLKILPALEYWVESSPLSLAVLTRNRTEETR